jgi:hypothetical protein
MTERGDTTAGVERSVETDDPDDEIDTSHLDDVDDGCGCAEMWEHMSDERGE